MYIPPTYHIMSALEKAAARGHYDAVERMLSRVGLERCGGASRGVKALELAAGADQVEVMELLTEAGVRDTGTAFFCALMEKKRNAMLFLRKQYERDSLDHINKGTKSSGPTLLISAIRSYEYKFAPKLVRWLLDAGASTTTRVTMVDDDGYEVHRGTARECMRIQRLAGVENGGRLDAIGRLLQQEDAIHAKSWLWNNAKDPESVDTKDTAESVDPTTPIRLARRSSGDTSRVVLHALSRYCRKTDDVTYDPDDERGVDWSLYQTGDKE